MRQFFKIELQKALIQKLCFNTFFDENREIALVVRLHVFLKNFFVKYFCAQYMQKQARGTKAILGIFFDKASGSKNNGTVQLFLGNAIIDIFFDFMENVVWINRLQPLACHRNNLLKLGAGQGQ